MVVGGGRQPAAVAARVAAELTPAAVAASPAASTSAADQRATRVIQRSSPRANDGAPKDSRRGRDSTQRRRQRPVAGSGRELRHRDVRFGPTLGRSDQGQPKSSTRCFRSPLLVWAEPQHRQLLSKGTCPAAVAPRMHLHPNPVMPFVQLECPGASRNPKMPMMAAWTRRQCALALDDKAALTALRESLVRRDLEIEFEHGRA